MDELFLPLSSDRGFIIRKSGDMLIFRYRRLVNERYLYGDSIRFPINLMKKILDEPLVRGLLKDD